MTADGSITASNATLSGSIKTTATSGGSTYGIQITSGQINAFANDLSGNPVIGATISLKDNYLGIDCKNYMQIKSENQIILRPKTELNVEVGDLSASANTRTTFNIANRSGAYYTSFTLPGNSSFDVMVLGASDSSGYAPIASQLTLNERGILIDTTGEYRDIQIGNNTNSSTRNDVQINAYRTYFNGNIYVGDNKGQSVTYNLEDDHYLQFKKGILVDWN